MNQSSTDPTVNGCNMVCKGNALEWCGGGNRLNLYNLDGSDPVPTSTVTTLRSTKPASTRVSTSSRSISISSASSPVAPTPTGPITVTSLAGWNYLGCYSEATVGRALNSLLLPIPGADNSVEKCAAACAGYTYFGVEYGSECEFTRSEYFSCSIIVTTNMYFRLLWKCHSRRKHPSSW